MASATIASLDVLLKGNTSNFDNALNKSTSGLGKFRSQVNTQSTSINDKLNTLGSGAGAAMTNALTNPIGALKSAIMSIGSAFAHPIETAKSFANSLIAIGATIRGGLMSAISAMTKLLKFAFDPMAWVRGFQAIAIACWQALPAVLSLDAALIPIDFILGAIAAVAVVLIGAVVALSVALLYLAGQQATVIGSTKKMADTLNMSVSSLNALSTVGHMDLDAVGASIGHLERTLSEAALTGNAASAMLARLGLSARDLSQMLPDQQLRVLADALKNVKNQADRLRISQELFGKHGGMEMLQVMQNGAKGLDALQKKAEQFGLNFTEAQASAVRKSNKLWSEWKMGIQGLGNSLAIALTDFWGNIGSALGAAFGWVARGVRELIPIIRETWAVIKQIFVSSAQMIAMLFQPVWDLIKMGWNALMGAIGVTNETTWTDVKTKVLTFLIATEFAFLRWKDTTILVFDTIALAILEFADKLADHVRTFQNRINIMIAMVNFVRAQLGMPLIMRLDIPGLDAIKAQVNDLKADIAARAGALGADWIAFFNRRMLELNQVGDAVRQQGNALANEAKTNAPAMKGSQEAFAIIAGETNANERMYGTLNELLVEARAANNLNRAELRELKGRIGVAVARL